MLFASYMPFQRDARTPWRAGARQAGRFTRSQSRHCRAQICPGPLAAIAMAWMSVGTAPPQYGERSIERQARRMPLPQHQGRG